MANMSGGRALQPRPRKAVRCLAQTPGVREQALQALAQQPDASNTITRTLFVSLAMIESTAIYCFVVSMILLFANPFVDLTALDGGG